jgi:hypothetical protein
MDTTDTMGTKDTIGTEDEGHEGKTNLDIEGVGGIEGVEVVHSLEAGLDVGSVRVTLEAAAGPSTPSESESTDSVFRMPSCASRSFVTFVSSVSSVPFASFV